MSELITHVENPADSNATRPVPRFTLLGFIVGLMLGGISGLAEFLIHRRNPDDVAWPIYGFLYPLVGLGLGRLLDKYPHARRWVRPHDFFSITPLSQKDAQARDCRVRRFVGTGFGVGIVVAILAAVLDFVWRGWPFLMGTLIGGLLFCPYMGMLIGYNLSLRPGDSKPSIRNFRFRTRTLMVLVAYVAVLCGLGSQVGRYSSLAMLYHSRALNARSMVDVFQDLAEKNRANLKRADNAKDLRAGRIPDGITAAQKTFLKELEGKATEQYKQYRYGLIADGEDLQAKLASQNEGEFTKLVQHHNQLAEKYTNAAKKPWLPVEPDPPLP